MVDKELEIFASVDNRCSRKCSNKIEQMSVSRNSGNRIPTYVKVKSFAPRQIQRRLFAALVTLSRKGF